LEGGANVLAAAQAAGVRRYLSQSHSMRHQVQDWQMRKRPWHLVPRLRLQQVPAN
jgi:hypothetical protein